MRKAAIALVTLFALTAAFSAVQAQTPAPLDPAKVAAGTALYTTLKCGQCHMINKVGGKLASALDGVGTKLKELEIKQWLTTPADLEAKLPKKPAVPMSGWLKTHKLTDADVANLVAYMRSLK